MLFNSIDFLLFFAVVSSLYFILPHKFRWAMLLVASCVFYMFFIPIFILILFFTILIDYFAGILIEKAPTEHRKKFLIMSLVANIGVLSIFKYGNFFIENVHAVAQLIGWNYSIESLAIILPIGLSFHTFQAMSYTIEVYRGHQKAEKHLGIFALYVMYYPQLVAGPIERPQNLLPQFKKVHSFDYQLASDGLKQMLWGLFKKVVIADRLSVFVNAVYGNPQGYDGMTLWIATVFFALQIFCDFSGYSDIALGASKIMGIHIMQNFRSPYFSKSISEFWKRWHISLSTWFRDYLYIPLGGNKVNKNRLYFNLLFVFIVSGFWHGAKWTFVMWGGLHGFYLIFALFTEKWRGNFQNLSLVKKYSGIYNFFQIGIVFILVTLAWVFFRATDVQSAFYILKNIFTGVPAYFYELLTNPDFLWLEPLIFRKDIHIYYVEFLIIFFAVLLMETVHLVELKTNFIQWINTKATALRWAFYVFLIYMILFFGAFHNSAEFIYFQF